MLRTLIVLFALVCLNTTAIAQTKKLYKYVDEKGNVTYSDKVPPSEIKQGRTELNNQGIETASVEKALTADQLAERKKREAEERRVAAAAKASTEEDRRFMASYATEEDLHRSFNQNVELLSQQIDSSKSDVELRQKSLDRLISRAAELERQGKTADPTLLTMVDSERKAIVDQTAYISAKQAEKAAAEKDYKVKLERYRALAKSAPK